MTGNASKLAALTKELSHQWRQTRESWRDTKAQEFEHKYMAELVSGVDKAVTVMEQLDKLITKVRHDCE